jgi:hypothetical protein
VLVTQKRGSITWRGTQGPATAPPAVVCPIPVG